jgi:hypothetical protein
VAANFDVFFVVAHQPSIILVVFARYGARGQAN